MTVKELKHIQDLRDRLSGELADLHDIDDLCVKWIYTDLLSARNKCRALEELEPTE